jgi:hypothetical protein
MINPPIIDRLRQQPKWHEVCDKGFEVCCPSHDDKNPSLSVRIAADGKVLLHCHSNAGCTPEKIVAALGMRMQDLYPPHGAQGRDRTHQPSGTRTANPKKRIPTFKTWETACETAAALVGGRFVACWHYYNVSAEEVARVARFDLPNGGKTCRPFVPVEGGWQMRDPGESWPLYNLRNLSKGSPVFVTEGEKSADAALKLGLTATTSAHGCKAADKTDWSPLAGRKVCILPDNDEPGERYAADVAIILSKLDPPAAVKIVRLPGLPPSGDCVEYAAAGGAADEVLRLVKAATPWSSQGSVNSNGETRGIARPLSVRELLAQYPAMRPPVIHGLLRRGETINVVAPSKTGKSWLVIDLAIALATGKPWLGRFKTERGDVLILDNELHSETSAARIPMVAEARGVRIHEFADHLYAENLRGKLRDIYNLDSYFDGVQRGRYRAIILDAFYRFLPPGTDENDNAAMAAIYSRLDKYADALECSFILIHHSSKGSQSDKNVTDVGSGAGSQSRACDTHLVMRQHEEDDVVVLEAAVRSWERIEPFCLRQRFPIWSPDGALDARKLRRRKRRSGADKTSPVGKAGTCWTPELLVKRFVSATAKTRNVITLEATGAGVKSARHVASLLDAAVELKLCHKWVDRNPARPHLFATIPQPDTES